VPVAFVASAGIAERRPPTRLVLFELGIRHPLYSTPAATV
jgi:hypothetical protein